MDSPDKQLHPSRALRFLKRILPEELRARILLGAGDTPGGIYSKENHKQNKCVQTLFIRGMVRVGIEVRGSLCEITI